MSQVKSEIICASCHESIIKGGYVRAGGSIYHAEHFVCHHCKQPLKNEGFVKHEDHIYCQNDYTMLFADKCEECLKPLVGSYLSHHGKFYHKDCFICNECKKPFEDLSFITIIILNQDNISI